jgi:ubiquinone/menaquinone biosynthesis C-methylase UbiE
LRPLRSADTAADVDAVNRATMRSSQAVTQYARSRAISPCERVVFDGLAPEMRGRPILDIGVGGGRTVEALRAISEDYTGIDYEPKMIATCRARFPGVRFEVADVRDLARFADRSFSLVVFSCNGLGMIGHDDRLVALREILRVLRPDGAFMLSSHNKDSSDYTDGFTFPEMESTSNPLRAGVRALRFARDLVIRARNHRRYSKREQRGSEWSIINDRCHNYGTMLYYIALDAQRRQLAEIGFAERAPAYDLAGRLVEHTTDSAITYVARPR